MSFTVRRISDRKKGSSGGWKVALLSVLAVLQPIATWAIRRGVEKVEEHERHRRMMHMFKRGFILLCALLLSIVLVAGVIRGLAALKILSVRTVLTMTAGTLPTDRDGHTNILLLGAGDETHDGVDLTDSIMVASIDPGATKSVALLSLPRDLYFLHTKEMGKGRINSLYRDYKHYLIAQEKMPKEEASRKALQELTKEIGDALGVQVHHVIKVDFVAFVQAVDALGGIDIVVPADLVDPQYPGPNYTYQTFEIAAGPQHLDGETALQYARSRHSTSDFDRSARQQQLIKALLETVRNDGLLSAPNRLLSLFQIMKEHVEMTFDTRGLLALAKAGMEIDRGNIVMIQLNNQNGLYGELSVPGGLLYNPPREEFEGASILLPVSIPEFPVTWKQVRLLTHLFFHERTAALARSPITILNAGAPSGSGRRLADELTRFGFIVDQSINAGIGKIPLSFIADQGIHPTTEQLLAELLRIGKGSLPPTIDPEKRGQITIILGEDYRYTPLQDLVSLPE